MSSTFDIPYETFSKWLRPDQLLAKASLKEHTTFKIGGLADLIALPKSSEEIAKIIDVCHKREIPFMIMGKGSNLLFSDRGYRGVLIKLANNVSDMQTDGSGVITAQAGVSLSKLANYACDAGLCGLEFASGIPGTVGGAVYMNAGAYDGEMKDVVEQVEILMPDGIHILSNEDLRFAYRSSVLQQNGAVVLSVTIRVRVGEPSMIKALMDELNGRRRDKQPLEWPSAGSVFKRPKGFFAGKLIMDSGLMGYTVGGAQVSEKHCGFIINTGGATSDDVRRLIRHVQTIVYKHFHIMLEPEIKILGV